MSVTLSIIIPCYNEVASISNCVEAIKSRMLHAAQTEIIVADGGSTDGTLDLLKNLAVTVLNCPVKGRASQMNFGAAHSRGILLYFIHADTIPPLHFDQHMLDQNIITPSAGCFRLKFDSNHWFLKANAWFTRFPISNFRFGDQSLFIPRASFVQITGFNEKSLVFEDQEIIRRIQLKLAFHILPFYVTTSARMYRTNGIYFTQIYYFYLYLLYKNGIQQEIILRKYRRRLTRS